MGDTLSKIADDIEDYEMGCMFFGVTPVKDERGISDCYGKHAARVKKWLNKVNALKQKAENDLLLSVAVTRSSNARM